MKKVININFQGRVVPIEETAFELLKQYTDSLRVYFANEEGRDEIINDIESRIGELFQESVPGQLVLGFLFRIGEDFFGKEFAHEKRGGEAVPMGIRLTGFFSQLPGGFIHIYRTPLRFFSPACLC